MSTENWRNQLDAFASWSGLGSPRTLGRFSLDTSCFIRLRQDDPEMLELVQHRMNGHIEIVRGDMVDTELTSQHNVPIGESYEVTCRFIELHGICVTDDSRLGHTVLPTDEDRGLLDGVVAVLKPGSTTLNEHDRRDAHHVATAIRYYCDGFITYDENILRRGNEIKRIWSLPILTASEANERIELHKANLFRRGIELAISEKMKCDGG